MNPDKVFAIADLPQPLNIKNLRTFLQTSSWYRRFIEGFVEIARPLTDLTKKDAAWKWGAPQENAFLHLKRSLIIAPVLQQVDEKKQFTLRTNASGYALGAVLLQRDGHSELPIEYGSRLLTAAERNYTITEREALAVVWAV